jgi:hypothetical protein
VARVIVMSFIFQQEIMREMPVDSHGKCLHNIRANRTTAIKTSDFRSASDGDTLQLNKVKFF